MPKAQPCEHNPKKRCHECQKAINRLRKRKQYAADPQKRIAATQRWRDENPGKRAASERQARAANPEKFNTYHKNWRSKRSAVEREKTKQTNAAYYAANSVRLKQRAKERRDEDPARRRAIKWKWQGKIWPIGYTFESVFQLQNGRCANPKCQRNLVGLPPDHVHVDHDITINDGTPNIRGIVCRGCNVGFGHFDHDTDKLLGAVEYLKNPLHKRLGPVGNPI